MSVIVVSTDSQIVFKELRQIEKNDINEADLEIPLLLFEDVAEVDLSFDRLRIYVRKCPIGLFWVIMRPDAPAAMIRLQCDIIVPKIKPSKQVKRGIGRFFR